MPHSNSKGNLPGLAGVAALALLLAAVTRRRFRVGFFLLHVIVALGERWSEGRARKRVGKLLAARDDGSGSEQADGSAGDSAAPVFSAIYSNKSSNKSSDKA